MELFGIKLVGMNAETGHELVLTMASVACILLLRAAIAWTARIATGRHRNERVMFWTRQGASVAAAVLACRSPAHRPTAAPAHPHGVCRSTCVSMTGCAA